MKMVKVAVPFGLMESSGDSASYSGLSKFGHPKRLKKKWTNKP